MINKQNRILTDLGREKYSDLIELMKTICPEMMARKISRANVQQAYTLNMINSIRSESAFEIPILCVGCQEDPTFEFLKEIGVPIIGIDPEINGISLHDYYISNQENLFDIIFSTSVIEHVQDDEQFLDEICKLLNKGGFAVLTCDFKNDYKVGDPLIYSNFRFYTEQDLNIRFRKIIESNNCSYIGIPDWTGDSDFELEGLKYNFATIMFRKNI